MKNGFWFKILITLALILSFLSPVVTDTEAATTYSGFVKVSSTSIKEKASSKSKTVGTLKKGSIVNVYAKTKSGWSEVYFKNKKAFVATKHLKITKKISFLLDKTKVYTYEDSEGATLSLKYSHAKSGWNVWKTRDGKVVVLTERETKAALEEKEGNQALERLSYPLYVGKKVTYKNETTRITSLTKTVKTTAGTFKNCIELQQLKSGDTSYYAPGVGLVLVKHGKTVELQLAQKKTEKEIIVDEKEIEKLITRNTKNSELENINAYMQDITKSQRNNPAVVAKLKGIFNHYDLKYEIMDIKFLSMTNKEVIIEVKTKINATYVEQGYEYRNNINTALHSIIKEDGKFVIQQSGISDVEYIN
ncbi:SH3 domain-containing protein [Bacillus massilinigeriensis]|uniref:SH3 domain-containing protein n=1 Tax=Bacillus massilionigeriensis TaxID=1805475 RepID=UPI00096B5657|nr:SH3 domain-containing protein [Bacillus massilionigeriensis]